MDACLQGESRSAGSEHPLTDAALLQICRAPKDDPNITPDSLTDLRLVAQLVARAGPHRSPCVEGAMTLLACVLGRLDRYNPTHMPFGCEGPTIQSRGWLDREALERVGQQVVGLIWNESDPETVSVAVRQAVSRALRFGFMEHKEYDAWRPGMPSGSGWRSAVTATLYGITRARALANQKSNGEQTHHPPRTPAPACVQQPAAEGAVMVSAAPVEVPNPVQKAVTAPAADEEQRVIPAGPAVQLGRRGEPCHVCGKNKRALTDAQYSVIQALQEAGEEGLTKDALEAVRPSARSILKNLLRDPDWADVILMPGQTNGRYRIRA